MNTQSLPTMVVVGAAGGIGLEIVRQLKGRAQVLAVVQNEQQIAAAREAGATDCIVCDVADTNANEQCTAAIRARGPLHGLIFCAAMQPAGVTEAFARSDLERLFSVNVFGTLQFVQGLLPVLLPTQGRIVLFSSMAGRLVAPMLGAYSASKYALEALADAMRVELRASGVTISLIEPGGVDTPMARGQVAIVEQALTKLDERQRARYEKLYKGYLAMMAQGLRFASRPEKVARVAVDAAMGPQTPQPRYVVGKDAKLMVGLKKLLPTRSFDALMISLSTRG